MSLPSCSVVILTNIICSNRCRQLVQNTRRQDLLDLPTASLYCRRYLLCSGYFEETQFCILPRGIGWCGMLYQLCFWCPTHNRQWPQGGDDYERDILLQKHLLAKGRSCHSMQVIWITFIMIHVICVLLLVDLFEHVGVYARRHDRFVRKGIALGWGEVILEGRYMLLTWNFLLYLVVKIYIYFHTQVHAPIF